MSEKTTVLGTTATFCDPAEIIAAINSATSTHQVRIATVNPEFLIEAKANPIFRQALTSMTHCTVDGSGLLGLLHLMGKHVSMYHGADLVADLFKTYQNGERSFFLLGGSEGLATSAAEAIIKKYPKCKIVGAESGGTINRENPEPSAEVLTKIVETNPDILLVGFGAPKQELFIANHHTDPVPVMIGIGGTFGFYTTKKRAPAFMRALHLEWLFRTFTEPGHWRRAFRATFVFAFYAFLWVVKMIALRGKDRK